VQSPRFRSACVAAAIATAAAIGLAGSLLAACASAPSASSASSPGESPRIGTAPRSPAAGQHSVSTAPHSFRHGSTVVTASCLLGIYDQSQNEFYALSGLAHGSDMTPGDPVAEAYQLTLAVGAKSKSATVTGFTVAVYVSRKDAATMAEQLPARRLIPAGQSMTFTEYPWGTSTEGHGPSVGPFAKGKDGALNMAATCRLLRWNSG
jgi:hypothetical protein